MQDQSQQHLVNSGGHDAVRETVMANLRAGIRQRQMNGSSTEVIHDWIDAQFALGDVTEEEAAVARLVARHYTSPDVRSYLERPGAAQIDG